MSFSVFRRVVEKGIFRNWCKLGGDGRMMSSIRSDVWRPLLMVPHLFDDSGNVVSKFHSVGIGKEEDQLNYANKISGIDDTKRKGGGVQVVGMSQGWLALYNQINHGIHILNPIDGHRIKLPSLPHHPHSSSGGGGGVSRVVLSHSPDQSSSTCRAVMIYNGGSKLAYCVPGSSNEWTPIVFADHVDYDCDDDEREYEDVLYEDKDFFTPEDRCEFHCLTSNPLELETWDVTDPLSPILIANTCGASNSPRPCRSRQDWELKNKCWRINYLMHGSSGGYLYLVVRYVLPRMHNPNPNPNPNSSTSRQCHHPYKTIDFDVYRINVGPVIEYDVYGDDFESNFLYMKASLDGVAIFIGTNCSTSVIASEHPDVRPNCIYYTDDNRLTQKSRSFQGEPGGHDNGIFDYQNNTFSACSCGTSNCPLDNPEMVDPAPIWFHFPSPPL